jgi:hypothetical protein
VRAQLLLVGEELRLLEFAHQLAQLEHHVQRLRAVLLLRRQVEIALRRRVLGEAGLAWRRSSTRSKLSVCATGSRVKSIAPATSQAFTQSRWLVQASRLTW